MRVAADVHDYVNVDTGDDEAGVDNDDDVGDAAGAEYDYDVDIGD